MRGARIDPAGRSKLRTHPTKSGAVALIFAVFFFAIGSNVASGWILLMSSLCVAVPVLSFVRSISGVRGIEVWRQPISRGQAGAEMQYRLNVRTLRGRVSQLVFHDAPADARPVVLDSAERGAVVTASVSALPGKRGWFEDPPIEVECAAPLGLWTTRRLLKCPGSIEIAPALPPIRVPWHMGGHDPLAEGLTEPPRRGTGLDFLGLRDYQSGDSIRHIHWVSSARRDDLVVREFQQEGVRPIVVIPDVSCPIAETERIISIAGSLVRDAITRSIPVFLALPDGRMIDSPHVGLLTSELARLRVGSDVPNVNALLGNRRLPAGPLFVVVSAEPVGDFGPAGAVVLIGEARDLRSKYPIWWCPAKGDAWLTGSLTPSAA